MAHDGQHSQPLSPKTPRTVWEEKQGQEMEAAYVAALASLAALDRLIARFPDVHDVRVLRAELLDDIRVLFPSHWMRGPVEAPIEPGP